MSNIDQSYDALIDKKRYRRKAHGFSPSFMPDYLFDFQKELVTWACETGKAALFEDCGLGKTVQFLTYAENVKRQKKCNVLIFAPLAVAEQIRREGEKFGIDVCHCRDGKFEPGINVTNYERIDRFRADDWGAVILDESSIIKNFAGKFRDKVTSFMEGIPFRLLASATPSPNDFMELGTSSEALGYLRRVEMLSTFFVHDSKDVQKWAMKGHGKKPFWRWMATWARAVRKPSDIGYDDGDFVLPEMRMIQHVMQSKPLPGQLFATPALTLNDQRRERRSSISDRCDMVAEIANAEDSPFIAWGDLNDECDMMERVIKDSVQISGSDKDTEKEAKILDFVNGNVRALVTKPKIAGFGLNFQHCNRMSFFPSHSHEQFYQASRRCWRFGQKKNVECHIVTTEAEQTVIENMKRKEAQSMELFSGIVSGMKDFQTKDIFAYGYEASIKMEIPKWLK